MMGDPSPRPYCVSVCGAETHAHGSKSSRADEMHPKVNGWGRVVDDAFGISQSRNRVVVVEVARRHRKKTYESRP